MLVSDRQTSAGNLSSLSGVESPSPVVDAVAETVFILQPRPTAALPRMVRELPRLRTPLRGSTAVSSTPLLGSRRMRSRLPAPHLLVLNNWFFILNTSSTSHTPSSPTQTPPTPVRYCKPVVVQHSTVFNMLATVIQTPSSQGIPLTSYVAVEFKLHTPTVPFHPNAVPLSTTKVLAMY